jgi:hypothetical protein
VGREKHAVEDLQAHPQSGRFKMQLAKTATAVHLVAYEQRLPIKTADDLLEIRRNCKILQIGKTLATLTDASG